MSFLNYPSVSRALLFSRIKDGGGGGGGDYRYAMTSLLDSRSQELFGIDPLTGEISTRGEIDREFMDVHYFKVTATQAGSELTPGTSQTTATARVQINVRDINDNPPVFEQNVYNASVR